MVERRFEWKATWGRLEIKIYVVGVGVKTGGSRVGGPDLCMKADGNRKQGTQMFTKVRALSM